MTAYLLPLDYNIRFTNWTKLLDANEYIKAETYYFEKIMPSILPMMRAKILNMIKWEGLISLLGFTPETVVLTASLLEPKHIIVLYTKETEKILGTVKKLFALFSKKNRKHLFSSR